MSEEKNGSDTRQNVPSGEETAKPTSPEAASSAPDVPAASPVQESSTVEPQAVVDAGATERTASADAPSVGEGSSEPERPKAVGGVEEDEAGAERPAFRPRAEVAENDAEATGAAPAQDSARSAEPSDASQRPEEAPEYAPRPSDGVEEDGANTPKFADQHAPKAPKKERPAGSTGLIHRSNIAEMHPKSAENVKGDFLLMLSDSEDQNTFQGKRMTVTLGFKSKYVFDGEKVARIMRQGAVVKQMEVPDEIVIGKVNDERTDPLKLMQAKKERDLRNRGNIDAVAVQASAVLKERALGRTGPTELSPVLDRFNVGGEMMGAAIVGERLDALNDDDLRAFAEKRTGDVSIAASRLMTFGIESPDPQKAAEYARDASAVADVDPSAPVRAAGAGKDEVQAPEPTPEGVSSPAQAAPASEPVSAPDAPAAEAGSPAPSVSAPEPAPVDAGAAPVAASTPEEAKNEPVGVAQEPAGAAPETVAADTPSRQVLTLRGLSKGVGDAAATPASGIEAAASVTGDAGPRNIRDQARLVTGEGVAESRSKGNEAANDASNVIAFVDKSKGRD